MADTMDFFAPDASRTAVSAVPTDTVDPFAEAIGRRFGSSAPLLTARLLPDESPLDSALATAQTAGPAGDIALAAPPIARSSSSQAATSFSGLNLGSPAHIQSRSMNSIPSPSSSTPDTAQFTAVTPNTLAAFLALAPPPLIIDVRSSGPHAISHVRGAISLSVPSTLLKRPKFPLTNLATMIASGSARRTFESWPSAARILIYDADLAKLADGSGVLGLLRKFEAAGFQGELAWLLGGHNAVARTAPDCLESGSLPSPEPEGASDPSRGEFLNTQNLPQSAFQQSSTTGFGHRPNKLQASNPFFDNIRQNQELSHGITERIPLSLPEEVLSRKDEIPVNWLRGIVEDSDKERGIEALAMQFYRIELGEQRRLQGVMSHHSMECQAPGNDEPKRSSDGDKHVGDFPYSITAGVEKGSKNRYKNIWPYEHARVRLQTATDDGSDYVNASHVQPRGTRRSYIATQGPMPSTYVDFWTMVWEQNVHVIVMLTRQVENNQLKCGDYWSGKEYGPLRLQLISTEGGEEEVERINGFDFGQNSKKPQQNEPSTIRRTFALSHLEHPEVPPRKVVQFQFLSWMDLNVPDTTTELLELVKDVREASEEAEEAEPESIKSPVLVHCSAGVGRTGSFVAIDAILDTIRHDLDVQRQPSYTTTATNTSSDNASDSSPEDNPSSDSFSNTSPRLRRASHPESDLRRQPPSGLLHITPARQRQRSLRKTIGARRAGAGVHAKPGSPPSDLENNLPMGTMTVNGAGGAPAAPFTFEYADASRSSNNSSASSFNFSTSMPSSSTSSGVHEASASGSWSTKQLSTGSGDTKLSPTGNGAAQDVEMSETEPKGYTQRPHLSQLACAWSSNVARTVEPPELQVPTPLPALPRTSIAPSPRPDSTGNRERDTFDYVLPRSLDRAKNAKPASPLQSMEEPIREVLEDMREQRMSLVQSLRQYVFVHRAVVEGVLAMIDDQRAKGNTAVSAGAKRHASPTELVKVDMAGSKARVKKRPSELQGSGNAMVVDS